MPNRFSSIVASQLVPESTYDARRILASYDYFVTEDGHPLIMEIGITPTLTPSSYFIDNA